MASQDADDITTCDLTGLAFARYQQQIRSKQVPEAQEWMELIEKQLQAQRSREQQGDYLGSMIGNRPTQQQSETQITQNDTVEGDEDDDEMLINEVKSYRCLWDTKCRSYKENPKKAEAWRAIASKLQRSGELRSQNSFSLIVSKYKQVSALQYTSYVTMCRICL